MNRWHTSLATIAGVLLLTLFAFALWCSDNNPTAKRYQQEQNREALDLWHKQRDRCLEQGGTPIQGNWNRYSQIAECRFPDGRVVK